MKRVQLQLPDAVVAWIDEQADGIESRASFIRRAIASLMKADIKQQQQQQLSRPTPISNPNHLLSSSATGER
jgi:metal-responsive CopG/Arc/MetJ family transcriptional regulator